MALEITNKLRSTSVIRLTGAATETVSLANLEVGAAETVNSASIKRVMWTTNGSVTIARSGEELLKLFNSGDMVLNEMGYLLSTNATSDIVVTVASGGTVILEVAKDSTYDPVLEGI